MTLLPTLLNFSTHNEDAAVELLVIDALGAERPAPLRVASVAACGTHVLTLCASPDVAQVDAIDVAPSQLRLGGLLRAAFEALDSPEELAVFIGNSGSPDDRRALYQRVRERTGPAVGVYWDEHVGTVAAGVMHCGGADRTMAEMRAALPTDDFVALSSDPGAVLTAFLEGMTVAKMKEHMVGMPEHVMESVSKHGAPAIAASASARLAQTAGNSVDCMLELILRGRFPMDPVQARPQFLRPEVFAAIRQNGCGPDRLAFHAGPLQAVAPELAAAHGAYDLADMSNILDMAPPDALPAVVDGVRGAVREGGALLCRGHKSPGTLATLFRQCGLTVDEELSQRALEAESSFFMSDVCVAYA